MPIATAERLITIMAAFILTMIGACILFFLLQRNKRKLNQFKAVPAGDGQHGNQHWITAEEKHRAYNEISFGKEMQPGFLVGVSDSSWLVDTSDNSALMLAPPGAGKSTSQYIPNIKYNASVNRNTHGKGASMVIMDVKGDLYRKTAPELQDAGYRTPSLDLRAIFHSSRYNLMYRVNREIDAWASTSSEKSKALHYSVAERYAKVISNAIIGAAKAASGNDSSEYFNETSRGLITGLILLVSRYGDPEERHIISVFQIIVNLSGSAESGAGMFGQQRSKLADMLDGIDDRRIRGYIGTTTSADIRTTLNIISSALAKLLKFVDAELEQELCSHDNDLDASSFIAKPTAIFLIVPDENETRNFLPSLFIRFLTDDLITAAEVEYAGVLPRPFYYFFDEFGNYSIPGVTSFFSAVRSRGGRVMAAIQSESQLLLKYTKEEAGVIKDTCQIKLNTFVSPSAYETAKAISDMLGQETILTGSTSVQNGRTSRSAQLMGRRLMEVAALVTLPRDVWIVQKAGYPPMKSTMPGYWHYMQLANSTMRAREEKPYQIIHILMPEKLKAKISGSYTLLERGMFDKTQDETDDFDIGGL